MTNETIFYMLLTIVSGLLFLLGVIRRDARANGYGGLVIVGILLVAILQSIGNTP